MRVLYIALGLVVFLTGLSIVFLPDLVNWNQYRDDFSRSIEEVAGRKAEIKGGIHLEVFPKPMIVLEDVRLANRLDAKHEHLLTFSRLEANLSVMDLLFGDLVMKNLHIQNPVLNLDILQDGTKAWEENEAAVQGNVMDRLFERISFDDIQIEGGRFTLFNGTTDKLYTLDAVTATLVSETAQGPFSLQGDATAGAVPFAFQITGGRRDSSGSVSLNIKSQAPSLDADMDFQGVMISKPTLDIQGDLTVTVGQVKAISDKPFIALMGDKPLNFKSFISAKPGRLSMTRLQGTWGESKLEGQIHLQEADGGAIYADTELRVDAVSIAGATDSSADDYSAQMKALIGFLPAGKGYIKIDTLTSHDHVTENVIIDYSTAAQGAAQGLTIKEIAGRLGDKGEFSLSGLYRHSDDYQLQLSIEAPDLKNLQTVLGDGHGFFAAVPLTVDDTVILPVKGVIALDKNPDRLAIKAESLTLGEHTLHIEWMPSFKETPARFVFKADAFDADRLGAPALIQSVFERMESIKKPNLDMDVQVKALTFDGEALKDVIMTVESDGDKLLIQRAMVDGFKSTSLDMTGVIEPFQQKKEMQLNGRIKTNDIDVLTTALRDLTQGFVDLKLPVKGPVEGEFDVRHEGLNYKMTVAGSYRDGTWQFEGTSDSFNAAGSVDGKLRTTGQNFAAFTSLLGGTGMPVFADKPYDIYAEIKRTGDDLQLNKLTVKLAESMLQGSLRRIGDQWTIDIVADGLNVTNYGAFLNEIKSGAHPEKGLGTGDFTVKVKDIKYGDYTFKSNLLQGSFDKDTITFKTITTALRDTVLEGTGHADAATANLVLDFHVPDLDITSLGLALPIDADKAAVRFSLKSEAGVWTATGDAELKKGVLKNADIMGLSAGLGSTSNVDGLLKEKFATGQTDFDFMKARFSVENDAVNLSGLDIAAEFGKAYGDEGLISLSTGAYTIPLQFSLVSPAGVPVFEATLSSAAAPSFKADELRTFAQKNIQESFKERIQSDQQGSLPSSSADSQPSSAVDSILQKLKAEDNAAGTKATGTNATVSDPETAPVVSPDPATEIVP